MVSPYVSGWIGAVCWVRIAEAVGGGGFCPPGERSGAGETGSGLAFLTEIRLPVYENSDIVFPVDRRGWLPHFAVVGKTKGKKMMNFEGTTKRTPQGGKVSSTIPPPCLLVVPFFVSSGL